MDLVIAHVSKDYGRGPVLRDVSLTVRQGETVCLMGPSGLGKTTLLRCVAGLETPDAGAVTGVPRRLGYVFRWLRAGPCRRKRFYSIWRSWACPTASACRCRSCPAECAAG